MTGMKRRHFLLHPHPAAIARALSAMSLPARPAGSTGGPRWQADPFALGVASGEPQPDSALLWTRLYLALLSQANRPASVSNRHFEAQSGMRADQFCAVSYEIFRMRR